MKKILMRDLQRDSKWVEKLPAVILRNKKAIAIVVPIDYNTKDNEAKQAIAGVFNDIKKRS